MRKIIMIIIEVMRCLCNENKKKKPEERQSTAEISMGLIHSFECHSEVNYINIYLVTPFKLKTLTVRCKGLPSTGSTAILHDNIVSQIMI